jgi:hypothetical protein
MCCQTVLTEPLLLYVFQIAIFSFHTYKLGTRFLLHRHPNRTLASFAGFFANFFEADFLISWPEFFNDLISILSRACDDGGGELRDDDMIEEQKGGMGQFGGCENGGVSSTSLSPSSLLEIDLCLRIMVNVHTKISQDLDSVVKQRSSRIVCNLAVVEIFFVFVSSLFPAFFVMKTSYLIL